VFGRWLNVAETYLSYADRVLVLNNDGKMSEHIRAKSPPQMAADGIEAELESSCNNQDLIGEGKTQSAKGMEDEKSGEEDRTSRQTGDLSVYQYYFASISWKAIMTFSALQTILGFLSCFPSKLELLNILQSNLNLMDYSNLAKMVDRCQHGQG
jgi:hypothetical protein